MPSIDQQRVLRETFVREVAWMDEVGSTNCFLLEKAPPPLDSLPLLVGADRQTRGRGRGRNSWWAGAGALTFSLLLEPRRFGLEQNQWPMMSLAIGLSICKALESRLPGIGLRVKWPNDVYADSRKVSGILIETAAAERVVIGIGINVNNRLQTAPPEIRESATSLIDLLESPADAPAVLIGVLQEIESHLLRLGRQDKTLADEWRSRCFLSGRGVTVADGGGSVSGTCLGIEEDGSLRLWTGSGVRRVYGGAVREFGGELARPAQPALDDP